MNTNWISHKMLKDYYKILEIDSSATKAEIKKAFKKHALKWHPDRNPDIDTTQQMQEINEAYLILSDDEAKIRYDAEYSKLYSQSSRKESKTESGTRQDDKSYIIEDEILAKWIENAKKQARKIVSELKDEVKGASKEATPLIISDFIGGWVIFPIIMAILIAISSAC